MRSCSLFRNSLKEYWSNYNQTFLFVIPLGVDTVQFSSETPTLDKIKKKVVMVIKTRQMKGEEFLD